MKRNSIYGGITLVSFRAMVKNQDPDVHFHLSNSIEMMCCPVRLKISNKELEQSLAKNPDVKDVATNKDLQYWLQTKHALLVSVDVEYSFSITN